MFYLLLALVLTAFSFAAPATTWYFAQKIDTKQITAFTADGDVRPLPVSGDWQYALRVDAETVLLGIADQNNTTHLYRVTPDDAVQIALPASAEALRQPLAFAAPYVVLRENSAPVATPAYLINVETAQAVALTGNLLPLARISEDGQFLRYLSSDGAHWSLIERRLATGEERVIYSIENRDRLLPASADAHGERWMVVTPGADRLPVYNVITAADGTVTTLSSGTRDNLVRWSFFDDSLITTPVTCADACFLQLRYAAALNFLPLPAEGNFNPLAVLRPDRLLALNTDDNDFWLLDVSGDTRLGQYDPMRIFMPAYQLVSPDGRYVLTATDATRYAVWDLSTVSPVATVDARYVGLILYNEQGFLIHSYGADTDSGLAYRYADGSTLTLAHTDEGLYFDMLPDGRLIYMLQKADANIGDPGIYTYNPADARYALLVPDALLTYPQPLG